MPVIKSINANAIRRDAIALDLSDLRRQGSLIVSQAHAEAEKIRAAARTEAEALTSTAAECGYAEGREAGYAEGLKAGEESGRQQALERTQAQVEETAAKWTQSLGEFLAARSGAFLEPERDVLRFAIALSEQLIHRAIEVDPSLVVEQVRAALALVAARTCVEVVIHPADQSFVDEAMPSLIASAREFDDVSIATDTQIARGGCRVRTAGGQVDASINVQIQRIVEALLPMNQHDEPESS